MVFLRISPWKGILRFGKRGKLSPRYIGPYRATSGNTGEFDIRRGTSADPRPSRASSEQQDYSAGEGIVEESYSRGSYMGA